MNLLLAQLARQGNSNTLPTLPTNLLLLESGTRGISLRKISFIAQMTVEGIISRALTDCLPTLHALLKQKQCRSMFRGSLCDKLL